MDRSLTYNISNKYDGKKLNDMLIDLGYSSVILTRLRKDDSLSLVNGKPSYLNTILKLNDTVTIHITESKSSDKIPPIELHFDIVYEDEDIIVVNKPHHMPIHPSLNNYENSLGNALAYYYKDEPTPFVYRCINRLDRDTSGLTIVAKNPLSGAILADKHNSNTISRTYYAIVKDENHKLDSSSSIIAPIGRKSGSTIEREVRDDGDYAKTNYEIVSRNNDFCLIKLKLETGRTHQIRVHMAYIGHPLIGDFLYNPTNTDMSRQALHAGELSFIHPIKKEMLTFKAPLPSDMNLLFPNAY